MFGEQEAGGETLAEDPPDAALHEAAPAWHHQSRPAEYQGQGGDLLHGQPESPADDGEVQGNLQQTEEHCSQMWRETGTQEL